MSFNAKRTRCYGFLFLLGLSANITGCYFESEDDDKSDKEKRRFDSLYDRDEPNDLDLEDTQDSIASRDNEINVHVHYMIDRDIGANHTVVVEAFDNENFSGLPVERGVSSNFDATKQGSQTRVSLNVRPGDYFLRAYIEAETKKSVPYSYGKLNLVGKSPVGVFGALSGVEQVSIKAKKRGKSHETVHIYLDQLFSDAEAKEPTLAYLRLKLKLAAGITANKNQPIIVQLRETDDFEAMPMVEYRATSDSFLQESHPGEMELLSPQLTPNLYYLLVFVDANNNGYYDENEAAALQKSGDALQPINIKSKSTATVKLVLSSEVLNIL